MIDELVIKCMDYISTFSTRGLEYFIDTSDLVVEQLHVYALQITLS